MSKQITAQELAQIVSALLTDPKTIMEQLDSPERYCRFMTAITEAVCESCGGEVLAPASALDDTYYVGVHGNDSLPDDGGVWAAYDTEGSLWAEGESDRIREEYLLSGGQLGDLESAISRLMSRCSDLFEGPEQARTFLMEPADEQTSAGVEQPSS